MTEGDIETNAGIEEGAISLYLSSPPSMNLPQAWDLLTPAIRNRWRRRFTAAVDAAMNSGALEMRTKGIDAKPVPDRLVRWLEEMVGHGRMLAKEQPRLSRKQCIRMINQFFKSCEKALEDSRAS